MGKAPRAYPQARRDGGQEVLTIAEGPCARSGDFYLRNARFAGQLTHLVRGRRLTLCSRPTPPLVGREGRPARRSDGGR